MSSWLTSLIKVVRARRLHVVTGMCAAMSVSAGAAIGQECGCTVPLSSLPAGQAIGQLTAASGPVNVLGSDGWVSAASGTPLFVGSQIETGAGGLASLAVGGCSLNVGAQSAAALVAANQALCVSVSSTAPGANPQANSAANAGGAAAAGPSMTTLAIAGGGAAAAVGLIVATTGDDDDPVSQ